MILILESLYTMTNTLIDLEKLHSTLDDIEHDVRELRLYKNRPEICTAIRDKYTPNSIECLSKNGSTILKVIKHLFLTNKYDDMKAMESYIQKMWNNTKFHDLAMQILQTCKIVGRPTTCNASLEIEEQSITCDLESVESELDASSFVLRPHQNKAIEATVLQNYQSGIHNHIMGSGKTLTFLGLIWRHYCNIGKEKTATPVYLIVCNRKEILRNIFREWNSTTGQMMVKTEFLSKLLPIFDYNAFNVHDLTDPKQRDAMKHLKIERATVVLINTTYLVRQFSLLMSKIEHHLQYVTLDECHCISAPKFFEHVLMPLKSVYGQSIIGFSATPLRETKIAHKQLFEIFGSSNIDVETSELKINVISTYDLIDAMREGVILPFKIYTHRISRQQGSEDIGKECQALIKDVMEKIVQNLPYRKGIFWTKTVQAMNQWVEILSSSFPQYKVRQSSYKNKKYPNGDDLADTLDEFLHEESDTILVAVNRCREGSDIKNLDYVIWVDMVQRRSTLVSLQGGGRVLRVDPKHLKTHGVVIDISLADSDETYQALAIDNILGYYDRILELSSNVHSEQYYSELTQMLTKTKYDAESNEIIIQIDDNENHDNRFVLQKRLVNFSQFRSQLFTKFSAKYPKLADTVAILRKSDSGNSKFLPQSDDDSDSDVSIVMEDVDIPSQLTADHVTQSNNYEKLVDFLKTKTTIPDDFIDDLIGDQTINCDNIVDSQLRIEGFNDEYERIVCLYHKAYGRLNTSVSRAQLVNMINDLDNVIEFIKRFKFTTAKSYVMSLINLATVMEIDAMPIFRYLNEMEMKNGKCLPDTAPLISNEKWSELQQQLDCRVHRLPPNCNNLLDLMEYQRVILMIIVLRLPARKSEDIQNLRCGQDASNSNYYDIERHTLVYRHNVPIICRVSVPEIYHSIFDKYTENLSVGNYFFYTERKRDRYSASNFSVFAKKIFGIELLTLRNHWRNVILSMPISEHRSKLIEWF